MTVRIQIYCDVCKSSIDMICSARKVQAAVVGFNEVHSGLDCFAEQEAPNGEVQQATHREEGGPDQSGAASPEGGVEGEPAPGAGGQLGRRPEGSA